MSSPLYAVHGENTLAYYGYAVVTRGIGHDPADVSGEDFTRLRHAPVICRLNNGYGTQGTIPHPEDYRNFATRCANFVRASRGCHIWIVGNEPNHRQERPGGEPIEPSNYAACYTLCRQAIHEVPFHNGDQVLVAAVAPWNVDTKYYQNPSGNWIKYFDDVQYGLPAGDCDGFAVHTYAREQTPASITSDARMDPPFEMYHNGFRTYVDWMGAIAARFQGLPVYLTEFCIAGVPWLDVNTGCVQAAYREIDAWNTARPERPISCLAMYRWDFDQWTFKDKPQVQADFNAAVARGYTVPAEPPDPPEENMLLNPSFEGEWYNQTPDGNLVLPVGWRAEYLEGANPWFRPEIKPNQEYVTDGQYSIRAFAPADARMNFGIYQELDSVPGQWYKFSADVRLESNPPGELTGSVGIQPWGAGIFERPMIWGEETRITLEWVHVEVYAQAFGGRIRVVMGATNKYSTRNNTTWWDNARLELWECDGGTPPVEPPEPGECPWTEELLRQVVSEECHAATRYELDHSRLGPNE